MGVSSQIISGFAVHFALVIAVLLDQRGLGKNRGSREPEHTV
jgi:hypothetical protein